MLWRGGRRLKDQSPAKSALAQTNGLGKKQDVDVIVIDSDDDEPQKEQAIGAEIEHEEDEEEQDPDCPYPSIIQDLDIDLSSEVLHMAVPTIPLSEASRTPQLAKSHIILALSCTDGKILLMSIPLRPPKPGGQQGFLENEVGELHLEGESSISHHLAIKIISTSGIF